MKLSVVIPVHDEVDNVLPLAQEIHVALAGHGPFEIVFVDDGSTDDTAAAVRRAMTTLGNIRLLRHARRCGQSSALCTGIDAAQAEWIATLDGDCQNDPADIPLLLARLAACDRQVKLLAGDRRRRRDNWMRRVSSRVANSVRARLLHDGTPDTGCGLKLLHRETFRQLPRFDHMHRFLPALFQGAGATVMSIPVRHRPRTRGISKYGVRNRLWIGIIDMFGVRWLIKRAPPVVKITEE